MVYVTDATCPFPCIVMLILLSRPVLSGDVRDRPISLHFYANTVLTLLELFVRDSYVFLHLNADHAVT